MASRAKIVLVQFQFQFQFAQFHLKDTLRPLFGQVAQTGYLAVVLRPCCIFPCRQRIVDKPLLEARSYGLLGLKSQWCLVGTNFNYPNSLQISIQI